MRAIEEHLAKTEAFKNESITELQVGAAPAPGMISQVCKDTPYWTNGYDCRRDGITAKRGCETEGWTCEGYRGIGWCYGEGAAWEKGFAFGEGFNKPEEHCCGCGKGHNTCNHIGCGRYLREEACQCNDHCKKYNNCCTDYQEVCVAKSVSYRVTGFHQTSKEICGLIMASSFRAGSGGWCSDAIYFAKSPEATVTKAVGENSNDGCMIEAVLDMGRVKYAHTDCQHLNKASVEAAGYNSVIFNPGDGDELVLYDPARIISKKILPYNEAWRVPSIRRRRQGN